MSISEFPTKHILVANDDAQDRMFFQEVINGLPSLVYLTMASDGNETVTILNRLNQLPDVVFLDLNMPVKNGFECLKEMKRNKKLQSLPVIIFSTSTHPSSVNEAYEQGAHLYIRKPTCFLNFKKIVHYVLAVNWKDNLSQPPREEFLLNLFPDAQA
jgi:CheY-like chemotaxis protein